ncbi:MAG: hypothetical protein GXP19_07805 [Gammaproteobacteria bacterium]|nr:hypothetical protein [Gammaproteobacteria bacterium]
MKKRTLFLWTLLLSMVLLCAQGVKLHVHSLDHDYDQTHSHIAAEAAAKHSHLSEAHLSTDISHGDHHDEMVSEVDVSPYGLLKKGLLKKVSTSALTLALLATVVILLFAGFYQQIYHRRRAKDFIFRWRYLLFPPLRAPPL